MKTLTLTVVLLMLMPIFLVPTAAGKYSKETETFSTTSVPSALSHPMPPMGLLPAPTHTYNHWWILDYWDTYGGGSMPPYMAGEFIAEANTFVGLTEGAHPGPDWYDLIYYLPLNVAYGTSNTNCVWFQFALKFIDPGAGAGYPNPVTMQIWDIKGPANLGSDFHETDIGLAYTEGHRYYFSLTVTGVNTITFYIKDETLNADWSLSSWAWPITSTSMLADESMFSPSSAVEGYTEPSSSLSGTPFLQSRIGPSVTTDRHYTSGGPVPAGITTDRLEIGDYEYWNWMMLTPGALPVPSFFVDYPSIVHDGDTVMVQLIGFNGGGTSYYQSLAVSFPSGESVSNVAVVATNLTSHAVYLPGFGPISAEYGLTTVTLSNYLAGGAAISWQKFDTYYLNISFKPMIGSGPFTFYVKSIAAMRIPFFDTVWYPTAVLLGGMPALKDQQGEYVFDFVLTVDSIPPTTTLTIGSPKYVSGPNVYVTSFTPFTLTAVDNVGGSGVAATAYRIHSASYDSGWLPYAGAFYLTGLTNGPYGIDYNSTDYAGNVEATHTQIVILNGKATMIGLVKNEIQALINQVHGSTICSFFKNYLEFNVLMCAMNQANRAFDFAVAGDSAKANSALGACKDTMIGFKSCVMNLKAFGMMPTATANSWIAAAQTIINDINTAIATPI